MFEELVVEASIAKVVGSEMLDYVLDENVQSHGGNGYVKDYPAERHYRDARVNRIFEGTNEINRLLISGMLVRRAIKGDLPLIAAAKKLQDEVLSAPAGPRQAADPRAPLDAELATVEACKKVALMVLGTAMQTYGQKLTDEQEVLSDAADILMQIYAAESAVLRARQAAAAERTDGAARNALAAMTEGDTLRTLLAALRRLLKIAPLNTVVLRRQLADATVQGGRYILG